MRITLFVPCYVDLCFPRVAISMVEIFERMGHAVEVAESLPCCGQPAFNSGYWPEARAIATRALGELAAAEAVVVPSGSCGAMIKKFYPQLFAGRDEAPAAASLAARTFEFSEFLVNQLGVTEIGACFPHRVTYHDGCHGLRELGNKQEPRKLLAAVRDLELVEMAEAETCCGFGGTFAAKFPAISTAMDEIKCASALETGAEFIVSGDSSCNMQIQGLLDRQGRNLRTVHLAEVLNSR